VTGERHDDVHDRAHYQVVCAVCGSRRFDDGLMLDCPEEHQQGLLQTDYTEAQLTPQGQLPGFYRYRQWLPIRRTLPGAGRTVVYRSRHLGGALGLGELWVAFNGYWPEIGATFETGTFKELEAYTVLSRLPAGSGTLVVASAGNTGAAFAVLCSRHGVSALIVMPVTAIAGLRLRAPLSSCVRLVGVADGDYADAIAIAGRICATDGFHPEGGSQNIGRRDGLATVMLSAVEAMGRLPDYYFQAIGSGAGAIAVNEAARRVLAERDDGAALPRLILSQNRPFTPIYDAWRSGSPGVSTAGDGRRLTSRVHARELTNRNPPYGLRGGVRDALRESRGEVLAVDNAAVTAARGMFRDLEGVDIEPAAGVAVASLLDAVHGGRIEPGSTVLLNITGGGRARMATEFPMARVAPDVVIRVAESESPDAVARLADQILTSF
jgi:cysteate synthase